MARTVCEVMNPELFTLGELTDADEALDSLLELGITAAPVVDEEGRPVGVTSIRDLVARREKLVTAPAFAVSPSLTVEEAAKLMAERDLHHLVVVGSDGVAIGFVSSCDLLRALVGLPPKFPSSFPHHDHALEVRWTDVTPLDGAHLAVVPEGPGVIVLSSGGARCSEIDLWAEAPAALRARMADLLARPQTGHLARILARTDLRFRCARIDDDAKREHVLTTLRYRIERAPYPRDVIPVEG